MNSYSGNLVVKDSKIIGEIDRGNIALRILKPRTYDKEVLVNLANTGVQVVSRNVNFGILFIDECACDSLQTWENDLNIRLLLVTDELDYRYSKHCHKDVMQMIRAEIVDGKYALLEKEWVQNIVIDKADVLVDGEDKGGFIVSERGGIRNSRFFEKGVKFTTNSSNPYFFSAERISNVTFGSPERPILSSDISHKKFRIGDIKADNARCGKWTIHAMGRINLELSPSARKHLTIINYY